VDFGGIVAKGSTVAVVINAAKTAAVLTAHLMSLSALAVGDFPAYTDAFIPV
jgi:uncharacterized protein (DUF934 family)